MAKISPVSIKYIIHAKFEAEGALEKPDVIGAIFGQTEGLLGSDLEMRELQKEGKIGRIDVDLSYNDGKTSGDIRIPTSLDKAETTILGAAIETIERIGPSNSKIEVKNIEDVRTNKRNFIIERAKALLEGIEGSNPESRELQEAVKNSFKVGKMQEHGEEKLSAGDLTGDEIIIVEGRADVVNLMKNNIDNVISMNGTILPESVKTLSQNKTTTLFVDGDRGGQLIIKNVAENAKIDFIAVAPDGKEVEELAGKEILQALRKKVPASEYLREMNRDRGYRDNRGYNQGYRDNRDNRGYNQGYRDNREEKQEVEVKNVVEMRELTDEDKEKLRSILESIENTKEARILNSSLEIIKAIPISKLRNALRYSQGALIVVIDGKATPQTIYAVEESNIPYLVARNFAISDTKVKLISL